MDREVKRANLLGYMDNVLREKCDDEFQFERWLICGVPDGATEDDLLDIAGDDTLYYDCLELFVKLLASEEIL